MPRTNGGTGPFVLNPIYLAIPGTTILATQHNTPLEDIEDTFNIPQPIAYGGTQAASARAAMDNLFIVGADVISAGTLDLDNTTGTFVNVTGTTTVTSVALADTKIRYARAAAALPFTASASLIVNGSTTVSYTCEAGDMIMFVGYAAAVVRVWILGRNKFIASQFKLADPSDQTKVAQFNVASITTGTTRTVTVPNGSGTMALLELAQTFSGGAKTFTVQPVISLASSSAQLKLERTTTNAGASYIGVDNTYAFGIRDSSANFIAGFDYSGNLAAFGGQIAFPATQNPSSNPNTLDDYEEGTFTPIIKGSTSAGTGTYSLQQGRYTRIGDVVNIKLAVAWTASTGTGNLVVGGLPFNASTSSTRDVLGVVASAVAWTAGSTLVALKTSGNADISLEQMQSGGGTLTAVPMDTAGTLIISGAYFTD